MNVGEDQILYNYPIVSILFDFGSDVDSDILSGNFPLDLPALPNVLASSIAPFSEQPNSEILVKNRKEVDSFYLNSVYYNKESVKGQSVYVYNNNSRTTIHVSVVSDTKYVVEECASESTIILDAQQHENNPSATNFIVEINLKSFSDVMFIQIYSDLNSNGSLIVNVPSSSQTLLVSTKKTGNQVNGKNKEIEYFLFLKTCFLFLKPSRKLASPFSSGSHFRKFYPNNNECVYQWNSKRQ